MKALTIAQATMLVMALGCSSGGSTGPGDSGAGGPGGAGGSRHEGDGAAGAGASGGPAACAALDFGGFDAAVDSFVAAKGLPGASGVVVHRDCGVVHARGFGAYPADRVYLVGSASKVVTVGVLMRLADAGALDLDAP